MRNEFGSNLNKTAFRYFVFSLMILAYLFSSDVYADGVLDTVNNSVAASTDGWMSKSLDLAQNLFFGLAALEFAWSAIQLALKKAEMTDVMVGTLFKVMNLAFFAMVLVKAPEWIPAIIDSFKTAGAEVSGTQLMTPSGVIDRGITMAGDLITKGGQVNDQANDGIANIGSYMLAAIIIAVAGLMVVLGFAVVALQLFVALIESYIVIGAGALMLGFLGSRWTSNFGEKYFSYAMSVGIKLFTIYMMIGLGDTFFDAMYAEMNKVIAQGGELNFGDWLGLGGASAVYGGLGYMVPGLASSMLNGAAALSMSNVGAATSALAAAPVAGALATGAAAASAGGYAAGMTNLLKTKGNTDGGGGGGIGGSLKDKDGGGGIGGMGSDKIKPNKPDANNPNAAGSASGVGAKEGANGFSGGARDMNSDSSDSGGKKGGSLSERLHKQADRLQTAANRKKPNLVSDGNSGGSVSIRMGHNDV